MESRKWGKRVEWRRRCSNSWGTRLWLMQWLENWWAAPLKDKNKWGSNSTVADCLGTYSLGCSAGMMAPLFWPLLQALARCPFAAELHRDRPGSWCSGPPGWMPISNWYQKAHPDSGVPRTQTLTLIIFPPSLSASGCQCLSFAHPP